MHPLSYSHGINMPKEKDEFNPAPWQKYLHLAQRWRVDLENYAKAERNQHGDVSDETRELLAEADNEIQFSSAKLRRANESISNPDSFWIKESLAIETDRLRQKIQWRAHFAKQKSRGVDLEIPRDCASQYMQSLFDEMYDTDPDTEFAQYVESKSALDEIEVKDFAAEMEAVALLAGDDPTDDDDGDFEAYAEAMAALET